MLRWMTAIGGRRGQVARIGAARNRKGALIRLIYCLLLFEIMQVLLLVDWARHSWA